MTQQNTDERSGIAAAIVVHEGRVLMVRRRVSEGQLSWQFPAGEVEPGEEREDAAVRETQEGGSRACGVGPFAHWIGM